MDIANLFLRATNNNGAVYLPYSLIADPAEFTEHERELIENAFKPHVPERVDAMFNNWAVWKVDSQFFMAKRATWEELICTRSAEEMAQKITDYYSRN